MEKIFYNSSVCLSCKSCVFACAVEHSKSKTTTGAGFESPLPVSRKRIQSVSGTSFAFSCHHCSPAPCVEACIAGAMHMEDGTVICDTKKCVGCWMCVMACPFGDVKPGMFFAVKCDLCPERDSYACVDACPTKALFVSTQEEFERRIGERNALLAGRSAG